MSWFFGRKKHQKESPPDTPEEDSTQQANEYIIIEKQEIPLSPNAKRVDGLYPHLPFPAGATGVTPYPSTLPQQLPHGDTQNYLFGIPFKLSKTFDNDFEIDRLRADEILSFVLNVQNETYDYDFILETSVISELNSGAE